MTAVANPKIDARKYGKLLARTLPQAIRTEKENERMLAEVDALMSKPEDKLTPEEHALLELLFTPSKAQAKALVKFFSVSPELFI